MPLRWLDTAEVAAFGTSIVDEYCRLRSSTIVQSQKAARRTRKFDQLVQKTEEYSRKHALNFYKRAKLISVIKAGLSEKKISESEIDDFIKALLLVRLKPANK